MTKTEADLPALCGDMRHYAAKKTRPHNGSTVGSYNINANHGQCTAVGCRGSAQSRAAHGIGESALPHKHRGAKKCLILRSENLLQRKTTDIALFCVLRMRQEELPTFAQGRIDEAILDAASGVELTEKPVTLAMDEIAAEECGKDE